jgi:putative oxidoreductase
MNLKTGTMKKKILFGISLLFGLLFINGGLNKLLHYIPVPENMPENMVKLTAAFESIGWLMPLIAVVEIIGGALFITNKFRALGAIIIFPIMVGILLTHTINEPSGLPMALLLMGINLGVIFENREKYIPMIEK